MEPRARCVENEPLALFILEKREALAKDGGYKEKLDATISKAYRNVCDCNHPICSLRDASQIQGVGQWMLKLLKGFFPQTTNASQDVTRKTTSGEKGKRRYLPQKGSAPYAILLTLYKAMQDGREYMKRQELIDATDASGLSRMAIQPSKCSGPSTQFGYSTKDWYSGWSSMKTLVTKGLVAKSSCPAKYKLTGEGIATAMECLKRSGVQKTNANPPIEEMSNQRLAASSLARVDEGFKTAEAEDLTDLSSESEGAWCIESCLLTKYKLPEKAASSIVTNGVQTLDIQSHSEELSFSKGLGMCSASITTSKLEETSRSAYSTSSKSSLSPIKDIGFEEASRVKARGGSVYPIEGVAHVVFDSKQHLPCYMREDNAGESGINVGGSSSVSAWLRLPPLTNGEIFLDMYTVVLVLDDRERFMNDGKGNAGEKFAGQLRSQFQIEVEIRHLPVGDTLWIARHKGTKEEYVLDFIVERKKVSDLLSSIRDTRYKQQKLRLLRCGLHKLIYIVEGDPNVMDSAESIKTACFTTEIVEGFDVQRTVDVRDTLRKYGHLTNAISCHYNELSNLNKPSHGLCKTYRQFVDDCKDLEREKVSDVFGVMLMQVKQVTENIAHTILQIYPTPLSLVLAYTRLKGDERAQENLLKGLPIVNQSKEISGIISKRVFQFMWSQDAK